MNAGAISGNVMVNSVRTGPMAGPAISAASSSLGFHFAQTPRTVTGRQVALLRRNTTKMIRHGVRDRFASRARPTPAWCLMRPALASPGSPMATPATAGARTAGSSSRRRPKPRQACLWHDDPESKPDHDSRVPVRGAGDQRIGQRAVDVGIAENVDELASRDIEYSEPATPDLVLVSRAEKQAWRGVADENPTSTRSAPDIPPAT